MGAELDLRDLSPDWLEDATKLDRLCFASKALQVDFTEELARSQSRCLLAVQENEVVGYLLYWMVAGEMQILNVAVHPSARRGGIGRSLLRGSIERAVDEGAWLATLEVRKSNEAAIGLYERENFRVLGTRLDYYREPKEDALLMVRAFEDKSASDEVG